MCASRLSPSVNNELQITNCRSPLKTAREVPIVGIAGTVFQSTTCAGETAPREPDFLPELQSKSQNRRRGVFYFHDLCCHGGTGRRVVLAGSEDPALHLPRDVGTGLQARPGAV